MFKNKYLKITICLILIFTISINFMFYQKAQAVGITAGLAIKAMAVILSSMGVLSVVQNNGGIQSFFDEFILFNHEGLNALRDMAFNNIVHKVKIKANNVIASIREFFNSWAQENIKGDVTDIPPGTLYNVYENFAYYQGYTWNNYIQRSTLYQDDFNHVQVLLYTSITSEFKFTLTINGDTHYQSIGNTIRIIPSESHPNNTQFNFEYSVNVSETSTTLNYKITNYDENKVYTGTEVLYDGLIHAIENPPGYMDPTYDIPEPQSMPRNGVDIAWDEATNKSISYIPEETKLEKLIEDIANASVETFVEKYMSWGKATSDSLIGPIITTETRVNQETGVEEQVVVDVTETVFDDIYEETHTQTGLLGSILGVLTGIKDFIKSILGSILGTLTGIKDFITSILGSILGALTGIKDFITSIFVPEEFNALDFSPLQNIGIADKFPFSLPWDLKNSVVALMSNPEAPVFDVPIVSEVITLDFSEFESWASIIRVFTTLIFVIALIILTRWLI